MKACSTTVSLSSTSVTPTIEMLGCETPVVPTLAEAVNEAPGLSDAVPKQSANGAVPGCWGNVVESKQNDSPSDVVIPERVTDGCSLNMKAMVSPEQAV